MEKPITQTLAEADELLTMAQAAGSKTVVAHQIRLAPNILLLKRAPLFLVDKRSERLS